MRHSFFVITAVVTSALTLMFCSCQSQNIPQDPFQTLRHGAVSPDVQAPVAVPADERTTYHEKGDFGKINGENLVIRGQQPQSPLTVDPGIADKGLQIIAERKAQQQNTTFYPNMEYLTDGGDKQGAVRVDEDWTVHNLETEDTVAHFDTLDGRTLVEPSNTVRIYAPRFNSVRKIEGINGSEQITALTVANNQFGLITEKRKERTGFTAQETLAGFARTRSTLGGVGGRNIIGSAGSQQGLVGYSNYESVMLYSNLLRQEKMRASELALLSKGRIFAKSWQGAEGTKVRIDALAPMGAVSEEGAESFFQIEIDKDESKTAKLRLIKVADKEAAQPGDVIEFSLRFDNVGNQTIGNVTILDNLTSRLEFLPDTALSSLKSGFAVQANDSGSFTLRFEITEPLEPGQFGVVQFRCRVK